MEKKRRNSKSGGLKLVIFGLIIILVLCIAIYLYMKNKTKEKYVLENEENIKENVIEENPIKEYKAKLIATGDALLHTPVYKSGYNETTKTYDFQEMLHYIKDEISDYDIKYYNQEVIFDDDKPYSNYPLFNAPSDWGRDMIQKIGFNTISLATNHSMDCGISSAKKYASWWEEKEDVLATGMASSQEKRNTYKIMEVNGITYTMLSYTYGTNGIPVTEDYAVNLFDKETALKDINEVRDKVDVLIVAMHWGEEYNTGVTQTQKEQAKFLGENGVDIILGNHTHCIEPWEWIDEDTIVFYSFGNLVSSQMTSKTPIIKKVSPIGMLGTLEITKTVDTKNNTKTIKIDNIGADLIYTYRFYNNEKDKYDYLVIPFSKMERKYLNNYEEVYEEFSSILKQLDSNISIKKLPIEEQ